MGKCSHLSDACNRVTLALAAKNLPRDWNDEFQRALDLLEEIAKECKAPRYQDTLAWKLFVLPLDFYYNGQAHTHAA